MPIREHGPRSAAQRASPGAGWTDWDVFSLQETLLVETMTAAVDGRSCETTRAEAWGWIDSEDDHPFSFRTCAKAVGADPDDLRAMFRRQAVRLGLIAPL